MTNVAFPPARLRRQCRERLRSIYLGLKRQQPSQPIPTRRQLEQLTANVFAEYERAWPWLEKAVAQFGGTHRKEHVLERVIHNRAQLWTELDAAAVTSVECYDTGLVEVRIWLGGGSIEGLRVIEKRVEAWARLIGAQRLTILGRRGWLRALDGWNEMAVMMTKEI